MIQTCRVIGVLLALTVLVSVCVTLLETTADSNQNQLHADLWALKTPFILPQAGGGIWVSAAVVDNEIYCIGGYQTEYFNYSYIGLTLVYNTTSDSWTMKKPMPTPRIDAAVVECDGKIYVIGGATGQYFDSAVGGSLRNVTGVNEVYDPQTDTWRTLSAMPTNRSQASIAAYNGEIYVIGGESSEFHAPLKVNEVYNIANDSWTTKTPVPEIGVISSSTTSGDELFIFSVGYYEDYTYNYEVFSTQIYNLTNDSWSTGKAIPKLLSGSASAATTGEHASKRVYVFGGDQSGYGMNYTQVYDPKNDSWSTAADMPLGREMSTVAVVNDVLYLIGGSPHFMYTSELSNQMYLPVGYGNPDPSYSTATDGSIYLFWAVVVVAVSLCAVCAGLIVYFKKYRKHLNCG